MAKTEIERLKRAVLRDRKGTTRRGVTFNRKLRPQILSHAQERLQGGESLVDIATSVGIKPYALRHWIEGETARRVQKSRGRRGSILFVRSRLSRVAQAGRLP